MLRAQLLGGTPPGLLGAITGLTEARFPVHAAAHFSDGFPAAPAAGERVRCAEDARRHDDLLAGGRARDRGAGRRNRRRSATRPRSGASCRCATPTATPTSTRSSAAVAALYPVLVPHRPHHGQRPHRTARAERRTRPERSRDGGRAAALAGVRRRAPCRASRWARRRVWKRPRPALAAARPGHAAGARAEARPCGSSGKDPTTSTCTRCAPGVQVIAGTVLGHVGGDHAPAPADPHMLFQIRPAGVQAPLIDPKPILDGWVALENTLDLQGQGREPVPRDLADGRAGAARVQAAARAAGAARLRHPSRQMRATGHPGRSGRQARAGDARVPVGVRAEADRRRAAVQGRLDRCGGAGRQRARELRPGRGGHHRRQRRPDRRPRGTGLDRRHHGSQAAHAAGRRKAAADRQPDELSGRRPTRSRGRTRATSTVSFTAPAGRRRARRRRVRLGAERQRVDAN